MAQLHRGLRAASATGQTLAGSLCLVLVDDAAGDERASAAVKKGSEKGRVFSASTQQVFLVCQKFNEGLVSDGGHLARAPVGRSDACRDTEGQPWKAEYSSTMSKCRP